MILHAWYPVVTYRLSFGVQDRLSTVVEYLKETYPFLEQYSKEKLYLFLKEEDGLKEDLIYMKLKKNLYYMVPYRLLSPFFEYETRGIKDQKKNKLIVEFTESNMDTLYKFVSKDTICIRTYWMDYILKNQALIKGWIQYKIIQYLQSKNPNTPNISMKLEGPNKRVLTDATKFWKACTDTYPVKDIYTDLELKENNFRSYGNLSIDHFLPWSFVSHDEFWNLCPTFKNLNSKKSDRLPDLNIYLDKFAALHHFAIHELVKKKKNKMLEAYYSLNHKALSSHIISGSDIPEGLVKEGLSQAIVPLHQIALNQGFNLWHDENLFL
jgi:hypothetical protein